MARPVQRKYLVDGMAHFALNDMSYVYAPYHFGHLCAHDLHDASAAQHYLGTMTLLQSQTMAFHLRFCIRMVLLIVEGRYPTKGC